MDIINKVGNLEDLRFAMVAVCAMEMCAHSPAGLCRKHFFVRLERSSSPYCEDCQRKNKARLRPLYRDKNKFSFTKWSPGIQQILDAHPIDVPPYKPTKKGSYIINDLKQDWNRRNTEAFPESWEMQETPEEELVFFYCGDEKWKMTRSIFVTIEMNVEVS